MELTTGRIASMLLAGAVVCAPVRAIAVESFAFETPGASDSLSRRLEAASILVPLADEGVTDPQELVAAARAEYSRLLGALYDTGHYGGVITISIDGREASSIPPLATPPRIRSIVVRVDPGPLYLFSRAGLEPLAPGTDVPPGYAVGQPAATGAIRAAATAGVNGWRDLGYAKAEIADQTIVADHRDDRVAADLRIAPGRQLRYGRITVSGNTGISSERILAMSGLRQADQVYSPDELEKAAQRIRRSGAFRSVAIVEAEEPNADGTLDLAVQVAEEQLRRYGFGFAYATTQGVVLDAFWLHRNLLGGGERLRIEAVWSSVGGSETGGPDYSLSALFTRTSTFGPDTDFYIDLEGEILNEPDFDSNVLSFELGYTRIVRDSLTVGVGIGYSFSSVTEDDTTTEYHLVNLPLQATWDTRNSVLDATRGTYFDNDLTPFLGLVDTDSGVYYYGDARGYRTVGESVPTTLAGRLQIGSILGAALDRVPNTMRFYSGGGGTVRGQSYQSLGVELNGESSGGASFIGFSGEARAAVTDTIGVVAFYDYGVVGFDPFPENWDNSQSGAGLGLRYGTPVGPLRVDVAVPVSGDTDPDPYYLYIGIGQAF